MTTRKIPLEVATALSHSDYWCLQAQETRLAAQRIEAPEARADLLAKADEYDRLAACNSAWEVELRSAAKNRASRRRRQKPSET
ncbi:MAG: hypothetical protein WBZ67_06620 [Pseudolabrys sp.]